MEILNQTPERVKANTDTLGILAECYPDGFKSYNSRSGKALCPFHHETEASFHVYVNQHRYHCYSCGWHGDVFELYKAARSCGFKEALPALAQRTGLGAVPVPKGKIMRGDLVATYCYEDSEGHETFKVEKYLYWNPETQAYEKKPDGNFKKSFKQKAVNPSRGYYPTMKIGNSDQYYTYPILYRKPQIDSAPLDETIYFTEGEKDVETLVGLGLRATTTPGGANKLESLERFNILYPLKGRRVVIVPDHDEKGRTHALDAARRLSGLAASVKIIEFPGLPQGRAKDVSDYEQIHGPDEAKRMILELAEQTPEFKPGDAPIVEATDSPKKPEGNTQYKRLQKILKDLNVRVLCDENRRFIAHVETPAETYFEPILSTTLRALIIKAYGPLDYPRDEPIRAALLSLWDESAKSIELHKRALQLDNTIYISRHAKNGEMYAVTKGKYELTKQCPPDVYFSPDPKLLELPVAQDGGSISELWEFLPFTDENSKIICSVWPILAWLTKIQRRGLFIVGRDGSGKTTLARTIRYIFDPHSKPVATIERNPRDFGLKCSTHFVVIIDNIDKLDNALKDTFCQLITEGSFGGRTLFTNDEYMDIKIKGTFISTGKELLSNEREVLDRGLLLTMPPRCGSYSIELHWERLAEARPRILGTMLRALSKAMETVKDVELVHDQSDRWYDWMKWGCAVAEGLGISATRFQEAISEARGRVTADVSDSHPVLLPLKVWAADIYDSSQRKVTEIGPIKATEFYEGVRSVAERWGFGYEFPKSPSIFSREINKLQGMIQRMGIRLDHNKPTRTGSTWTLTIDGSNSEFNEFLESNQATDVKAECLHA